MDAFNLAREQYSLASSSTCDVASREINWYEQVYDSLAVKKRRVFRGVMQHSNYS